MLGAIVKNDIVQSIIVINSEQVPELETALACEIVDAAPYGLQPGDLRTGNGWTRNAGGEQMILPQLEGESYDSYTLQQHKIIELEESVAVAEEAAAAEALAILSGEVSE